MDAPVETEIKLVASPAMLAELRGHPRLTGADHTFACLTTYFDTPTRSLQRAGATLRLRTGEGGGEQTLKLPGAAGPCIRRREWTVTGQPDQLELARFPEEARAGLEHLVAGSAVAPMATAMFARTLRPLRAGSSAIELAFDIGTIRAGAREAPLCEVELELKEGRLADLLALARDLPLGPDLQWSVASKTARALALAFDLPGQARRAEPVDLPVDASIADGLRAICWNGVQQLLANYPLVIATGDHEALHQTRVAIRRLRAALSLFRTAATGPAGPVFGAELKAAAEGLAPARDLHLLQARVAAAASTAPYDYAALLAELGRCRDAAMASAQQVLAGGTFQRLLLRFAFWLEAGDWPGAGDATVSGQPLGPFANHILSRQFRKVRKAQGPLAAWPDPVRHKLRIEIKKLRYAVEFLAPLYDKDVSARHRKHFGQTLARLQDSLGELNDLAFAGAAPPALLAGRDPIVAARLAAELDGVLGHHHGKARRRLLGKAQGALDELVQAPEWWKEA